MIRLRCLALPRIALLCLAPLLFAFAALAAPATDASLPSDSIYRLDAPLSDQAGKTFVLADRRGRPMLISMFYTNCPYMCPLIIDSAKGIERMLTAAERAQMQIVLVSLDPVRDDTTALQALATQRQLDPARWALARTDADHVRTLAAVLGVRYRALADGEFNHTGALILLDADGRKLAETGRLGAVPDPEFLARVRAALATPPAG